MKILDLKTTSAGEVVEVAVATLQAGGLVVFPTETTYGIGAEATNQASIDKLLAYKSRREGKPLSIAVTDMAMAEQYVELTDQARELYRRFLPGPVTVVSRAKPDQTAVGVPSEYGTLGVRIPAYPLVLDIVKTLGKPMTATSANGSGEKRPYRVADIFEHISDKQKALIDLVIDAGTLPPNPPSTVIDTTLSTPVTLRTGELNLGESLETSSLISNSETETKSIAARLLLKNWDEIKTTGLVIGLDGALGVGKTIFTKGSAEFLKIEDTITSPTYTYLHEYDFTRHGVRGKLYHLDLWKVDTAEQVALLNIPGLAGPGHLVIIEWWSQVSQLAPIQTWLESTAVPFVHVSFTEENSVRRITIQKR